MISANHAYPDEMLHFVASQLGIYGLPTYSPGITIPGIQRIEILSKCLVLKVDLRAIHVVYIVFRVSIPKSSISNLSYVIHSNIWVESKYKQVLAFQKSWRSFSPIIVCILAHCMLPF